MNETVASVDPEQVAFYTRLADTWWDPDGPFWPLHVLNRLRARWIVERLAAAPDAEAPLAGLRVLDIGCGGGLLSEAMARAGAEVTGIDVTERNVEVARLHAERAGISVRYRHVADLPGFLDACCSLVRPGGHMFVATLNRTLAGFVIGIVGAEYVARVLPKGTHQWSRFVRPEELAGHLARGGLSIEARTGVRVNPFARRMTLTSWLGVNYMVQARKAG
jgi:2-polyprenyl-6-hydroxyphenyl methylase/3-demethylubiquinone-9 3-methyltransferase